MTFSFKGLSTASLCLAGIYFLLAVYTYLKLVWLQSNTSQGLNTRKLFVVYLLLVSVLRFMSFTSMAVLDFEHVDYNFHSDPNKRLKTNDDGSGENFFEKASLVLFDFPDFCCVSAYVLLIVIWADSYMKSRRHWLSAYRFSRVWMLGYFLFNIFLYVSQVALYSLLFIPSIDQSVQLTLIYLTLAAFNLALPIFWVIVFMYLSIEMSGFPFSTNEAKWRLQSLSRLGVGWSVARFLWGCVALTTVMEGWLDQFQTSKLSYTILLIFIFLLVEVLPIFFSLQNSTLQCLAEITRSRVIGGPVYGPVASLLPTSDSLDSLEGFGNVSSGGASSKYDASHRGVERTRPLLIGDNSSNNSNKTMSRNDNVKVASYSPVQGQIISNSIQSSLPVRKVAVAGRESLTSQDSKVSSTDHTASRESTDTPLFHSLSSEDDGKEVSSRRSSAASPAVWSNWEDWFS